VPRTFKEICAVSNSSKKDIGRCFKIIKSEVETNYNSTTPIDLIVNIYIFRYLLIKSTQLFKILHDYFKRLVYSVNLIQLNSSVYESNG
jgi:hypothetical protein